jgi:hypothetical protein
MSATACTCIADWRGPEAVGVERWHIQVVDPECACHNEPAPTGS